MGRISPKISTSTVVTTVATAAPASPSSAVATRVAMEERVRLTTLLPIRMAERVLS